jgi:hypothetical protein
MIGYHGAKVPDAVTVMIPGCVWHYAVRARRGPGPVLDPVLPGLQMRV